MFIQVVMFLLTVKKKTALHNRKKTLEQSSIIQRANDLNADSCGAFEYNIV